MSTKIAPTMVRRWRLTKLLSYVCFHIPMYLVIQVGLGVSGNGELSISGPGYIKLPSVQFDWYCFGASMPWNYYRFHWLKDGARISTDDIDYVISRTSGGTRLTFSKPTAANSGQYTCGATSLSKTSVTV